MRSNGRSASCNQSNSGISIRVNLRLLAFFCALIVLLGWTQTSSAAGHWHDVIVLAAADDDEEEDDDDDDAGGYTPRSHYSAPAYAPHYSYAPRRHATHRSATRTRKVRHAHYHSSRHHAHAARPRHAAHARKPSHSRAATQARRHHTAAVSKASHRARRHTRHAQPARTTPRHHAVKRQKVQHARPAGQRWRKPAAPQTRRHAAKPAKARTHALATQKPQRRKHVARSTQAAAHPHQRGSRPVAASRKTIVKTHRKPHSRHGKPLRKTQSAPRTAASRSHRQPAVKRAAAHTVRPVTARQPRSARSAGQAKSTRKSARTPAFTVRTPGAAARPARKTNVAATPAATAGKQGSGSTRLKKARGAVGTGVGPQRTPRRRAGIPPQARTRAHQHTPAGKATPLTHQGKRHAKDPANPAQRKRR